MRFPISSISSVAPRSGPARANCFVVAHPFRVLTPAIREPRKLKPPRSYRTAKLELAFVTDVEFARSKSVAYRSICKAFAGSVFTAASGRANCSLQN